MRTIAAVVSALILAGCADNADNSRGVCILGPSSFGDGTTDNALTISCASPNPKTLRIERSGAIHGPWTLPSGKARIQVTHRGEQTTVMRKDESKTVLAEFATGMPDAVISNRIASGDFGRNYRVEIVGVKGQAQTNLLVLLLDFP